MARTTINTRSSYSILLIVLLFSQLTSNLSLDRSHSRVEHLPGFNGPLPFYLETGYIGVDEGEDVQLFYYFLESENNPKEDPLFLWLTGGPGCSTISAIFYEIGPIQFENIRYNESLPTLALRPFAWTKLVNIIFVDLPVGTGFSYSKTHSDSYTGDFKASHNANEFLRKWLVDHPQFLSNPIYLAGDSYTGKTLPLYFEEMLQGNEEGMEPFLNLQGYLLGNPVTDPNVDKNHVIPFAHGMGLISDELYESLQKHCEGEYYTIDPSNIECNSNLEAFEMLVSGVDNAMILEPNCGFASPRLYELTNRKISSNMLLEMKRDGDVSCRVDGYILARYWFNDDRVQEALHVRQGSISEWIRCNYGLNYTYDVKSSVIYHAKLSAKGYRSLIYSGDHDMLVPFLATQAWIRSLNYSIVDDWRQWHVDGQIAGFTRTYSNRMTFATVKGAGHTAPEYKPKECAAMMERWLLGKPL